MQSNIMSSKYTTVQHIWYNRFTADSSKLEYNYSGDYYV
jgi:hypothetical protein